MGCGNAIGTAVPPFFVFKGKRFMEELMEGATPGAAGTMSDTGWSQAVQHTLMKK